MKKIALLVVMALAVAAIGGTAFAGKKKPVRQEVTGHIALQAPPADATNDPNGCYAGVHRRLAVATQEQVNGVVGYHFEVDPATWKKKFRVTPAGAGIDIDILFYSEFGTIDQATDTAYAPVNYPFEERNDKGEFGIVPADVTRGLLCVKVGNNVDFTYVAGGGVK